MTRSIFDPDSGETERSGSRNSGPDAGNISHMPPSVVDGESDDATSDAEHANVNEVALTDEEAAQRLKQMQGDGSGAG